VRATRSRDHGIVRGLASIMCAIATGCFAPTPQPGAPCVDDSSCPAPLVCSVSNTCQTERGVDPPDAPVDTPVSPPDGGCSPCEPNDTAIGAVDVTDGGMFSADALAANDDVGPDGCGGNGGRDLFYSVTLAAPRVFYFDTFGSSYDTVIRVFAKPCAQVGAGAGAMSCTDDTCGGTQSQVALSLPAGESCIVIDQADATQSGSLELRVIPATRDGFLLPRGQQTLTGDTCDSANLEEPIDQNCDGPGEKGKDHAYFFTTCPNESLLLDADICPEPTWDPVLYVKRINGQQIGCNDDSCGFGPAISNVNITNSNFFFLYVDGFSEVDCGDYSLDTNLR
jgi:hypothetical protein